MKETIQQNNQTNFLFLIFLLNEEEETLYYFERDLYLIISLLLYCISVLFP